MRHCLTVLLLVAMAACVGLSWGKEPPNKPGPAKNGPGAAGLPDDRKEALVAARWLEKAYAGARPPEAVRMLIAIANGTWMSPEKSWFGPCHTRYTFDWLARRHGVKDAAIGAKQFLGSPDLFRRLDRNTDGRITPDDLDWSEGSAYLRQAALVDRLFMQLNTKRDGKITQEQLLGFFKAAANGKDHLTPQDLRDALLAAPPAMFAPGDAPTQEMLVRSLFAGELGSLQEGPALNEAAPDFTLKTPDGKQSFRLSKLVGDRPLVLVFGNFTCAPFRRTCVGVEDLYQRYKDRATFLGVYVREAHPTDGWVMASNKKLGVAISQPKTYQQRVEVCGQFCKMVKPSLPFVVDEINDPVGNAYSGMPGRLYVIDPRGKVAYKSGRGPFGFKVGELEQALVMALLEFPGAKNKGDAKERTER